MRISHSPLLLTCSTLALCLPFASWAETGPPASGASHPAAEGAKIRQHQASTATARSIRSGTHPAPHPAHKPRHERIHVYGDGRASYAAEESSIGDKTGVSFLQQTQTANVVTHQTLQNMAPQTMEDMTKYVPGMTVGNNFAGTQDSLLKRGFGSNLDGSVLRDGIRMPNGRNFTAATAERVEVLKGPASLFYGMQEPGGVINIITKQPRKKWTAALDSSWASLGGGSGTLDLGGPLLPSKEFTFRLIANYKNENYWRNFGANKQKVVAPSFRYEHQKLKVDLSYQWEDYDNTFDRGAFIDKNTGRPISGPKYRLDEHGTRAYGTRHLLAGAIEYHLSKQDRLRLTSGWNQDDYHDRQVEPSNETAYNSTTGILTRRFRSNTGERRTNSYVALDYLAEHRFLSMTHKLAMGGDYENQRVTQGAFLTGKPITGFRPADPVYGQLLLTAAEDLKMAMPIPASITHPFTSRIISSWAMASPSHRGCAISGSITPMEHRSLSSKAWIPPTANRCPLLVLPISPPSMSPSTGIIPSPIIPSRSHQQPPSMVAINPPAAGNSRWGHAISRTS